jgi:hypothetical protein
MPSGIPLCGFRANAIRPYGTRQPSIKIRLIKEITVQAIHGDARPFRALCDLNFSSEIAKYFRPGFRQNDYFCRVK